MKRLIFLLLLSAGVASAWAQGTVITMKRRYTAVASPTIDVAFDTVTNAGTNYLTNLAPASGSPSYTRTTTIVWTATKQTGTLGGTVTLQGSNDFNPQTGVGNFFALTGAATGSSTTTFTATNVASQTTGWVIIGNPCKYYRVSWTGVTGPMAATQAATVFVQ